MERGEVDDQDTEREGWYRPFVAWRCALNEQL